MVTAVHMLQRLITAALHQIRVVPLAVNHTVTAVHHIKNHLLQIRRTILCQTVITMKIMMISWMTGTAACLMEATQRTTGITGNI